MRVTGAATGEGVWAREEGPGGLRVALASCFAPGVHGEPPEEEGKQDEAERAEARCEDDCAVGEAPGRREGR